MKRPFLCIPALFLFVLFSPGVRAHDDLVLTVNDGRFEVNGEPKFLVFVSDFDALRESSTSVGADFAWLKSKGVSGVRIFPNWWRRVGSENYYGTDTLITPSGGLNSTTLGKLHSVLGLAKANGLIVDLSFSAETVSACDCLSTSSSPTLSMPNLTSALVALAADLEGPDYAHVLFDLQNESNRWTTSDNVEFDAEHVSDLAIAIRAEDSTRILTASISGDDSATEAADFSDAAGSDLVAWHESRDSEWWDSTSEWVGDIKEATTLPVYLQEPASSADGVWSLPGIESSLKAAHSSGAAAWCFHTRAGYSLNGTSLQAELDSDELAFFNHLLRILVPSYDFTGDGKADLIWQHPSTGAVLLWEMDGPAYAGGTEINSGTSWQVVGTSDFTGDGKPDILWQYPSTGAVLLWQMDGANYVSGTTVNTGTSYKVVATGDFTGDGQADILWQHPTGGNVLLWEMNGSSYVAGTEINSGTTWQVVGAGDFTGDGKTDVVWQHPTTGAVLLWEMNGPTYVSSVTMNAGPTAWKVSAIGDYTGDGQLDIVYQHPTSTLVLLWVMDGPSYASASMILNDATAWIVKGPR